jgi:diguanylate cyclase (GGDEF)-like protein
MSTESNLPGIDELLGQLADKEREIQALRASLDELASHDPLTGVLNRRSLMQTLEAELQRSHRTGHPFCFAIIDIDHFKRINDQFGDPAGDLVLQNLCQVATKLLRVLDRFGRVGGDEFGIVLPATWLDQGVIAMGRLTNAVAAFAWDDIAPGCAVTFSAGLTTNAPNDSAEAVMMRAETALQQAKQEGRNRLVSIEEDLPNAGQIDMS